MGTGPVEREVLTALKKLVAELRHYQIVPIAMLAGEPLGQFSAALAQAKSAIAKAESAPSVGQQESEKFRHLASAMKKMLPPALLAEVIAHLDPLTPFVEFLRSYDLPASSVAAAPASNVHDRTVNNLRSIASDTTLRSLSAFDRRELLTAAAALEALSAAPAWRAMESAPKDGTHILCYHGGKIDTACWIRDSLVHGRDVWMVSGGFAIQPTHWMPLPGSPRAGEDQPKIKP